MGKHHILRAPAPPPLATGPASAISAEIMARSGNDLDDYLTLLQIEHDAEACTRRGPAPARKVAQARFTFLGLTGNSQISLHDAARNWARKVRAREMEAGKPLDLDTGASHVA